MIGFADIQPFSPYKKKFLYGSMKELKAYIPGKLIIFASHKMD